MADSAPGKEAGTSELVLVLSDPEHLFNALPVNPESRSDAEALGVSGVEHLFNQLHFDGRRQRAQTLTLILPPDKVPAALVDQTTRALHRYAELKIQHERRELRNTYRVGWRSAGVALVLLAICLGLSSFFGSEFTEGMGPLVRKTLENGFEIIGWVLLWRPIEVLGFNPLAIRFRIKAWRTLASIKVVIRADA